jgi:hypothetical protein
MLEPLRALWGDGADPTRGRRPLPTGELVPGDPARLVRCRECALPVADPSEVFKLGEGPQLYLNPHGILHEVLLVQAAHNLLLVGDATTEHTWFAGYAWRIALCARCRSHLGWRYEAADARSPPIFFGLRRAAIAEPGV